MLALMLVVSSMAALAEIPELTKEPMEILLWDIAMEGVGKKAQEDAVARFMADYPNIHVEQVHKQNDTYKQDLQIGFSAKEGQPDMYSTGVAAPWPSTTNPAA